MVVNERPSKRMKRRVSADLYDFLTFPAADDRCCDDMVGGGQPFRKTVQRFLTNYAMVTYPPSLFSSLMTWQILFRIGGLVDGSDLSPAIVTLDIVEEDVTRSRTSVYCDQCRVVGWSGHPVCRKRYHFIIRASNNHMEAYERPCSLCGKSTRLSEPRCKWCDAEITVQDLEDWVYGQIEDNTHLLHGIVHSNGYGHLLTLNGREGGSRLLSGSDIMSFWDRLCAALAVRKVSVMDLSKKFGMEYRLLHAIINGCSWYGNWGYEFGTGSYALTQDSYQKAVNTLSSMPLSDLLFQDRGPRSRWQCVISLYQSLADAELLTIKDLFSFLTSLIREFHKPLTTRTTSAETCNVLCAWSSKDVEAVQQALIKVLLASAASSGAKWVTRRALKGALSRSVASPELLDYSLKYLGGKLAAYGMVVRSRCNPSSSAVEFRLEASNVMEIEAGTNSGYPSKEQVIDDLRFLLDSIIHPERMASYRPKTTRKRVADSARKLLDCKQFMKDYRPDNNTAGEQVPPCIRLWCRVELSDQPKEDPAPPPELILLPLNATVADLKNEATTTFQEVYAMYKRFQAEELLEYGSIKDNLTVKLLLGTSGSVRVLGKCHAKHGLNRFRMERGTETWKVDCPCGAKDDDGEKMLACDTCGVWQHTRCAGIENSIAVPSKFVCMRCIRSYRKEAKKLPDPIEQKNLPMDEAKIHPVNEAKNQPVDGGKDYHVDEINISWKQNTSIDEARTPSKATTSCRGEVVAADSPAVACNLALNFGVR
ncbi:PHD finger protein At1g33420 [Neltuma alba]|uniref:PHD finger protein At1g33420 n=1 Tax=Neltuma alba TaxID=207710 RepID=UPI0010A2F5EF|nr:PHD finger protein At1g33420 [Prosopis alba]